MLSVDHVGTVILLYRLQILEKYHAIANMIKGAGAVHTICEKTPLPEGSCTRGTGNVSGCIRIRGKCRGRLAGHAFSPMHSAKTQLFRG